MLAHRLFRRHTCAYLLVVGLATMVTPFRAGAQIIRGKITDAESSRPLPAAAVALRNAQGQHVVTVVSDSAGVFELRPPQPDEYRFHVSLVGYMELTSAPILVRSAETVHVAIRLSTFAIPMDPVIVTARRRGRGHLDEFEHRRKTSGTGHFITRDEIEHRPISTVPYLLLGVPGVTIVRNDQPARAGDQIMLRGTVADHCPANVFVDGMRMPANTNLDAFLFVDWIEGIEVYARAGTTPAQYHVSDCGSVLFWTRERKGHGAWNWAKIVASGVLAVGIVLIVW